MWTSSLTATGWPDLAPERAHIFPNDLTFACDLEQLALFPGADQCVAVRQVLGTGDVRGIEILL